MFSNVSSRGASFLLPLLVACAIALLGGCDRGGSEEETPPLGWRQAGLDGLLVNQLKHDEGTLYAATKDGLYRKGDDEKASWEPLGLREKRVVDFALLGEGEILAAVALENSEEKTTLYHRAEAGASWTPYQNGFGGAQEYNTVRALKARPGSRDTVYARGVGNVAKSTTGGAQWRLVYGAWGDLGYQAPLLHFDPNRPGTIWAGGESTDFSPYLLKSTDHGESWTRIEPEVDGDNACYSMVVRPGHSQQVLVGMEGRILYSGDGGESWKTRLQPDSYPYFIDMAVRGVADATVYATGLKGGTTGGPLVLYEGRDFGRSWEATTFEEGGDFTTFSDMSIVEGENGPIFYFATGRGVYAYAPAG